MGSATSKLGGSKKLNLTFGIEFEFIVKYDPTYITNERRMAAFTYDQKLKQDTVCGGQSEIPSELNEHRWEAASRERRPTDRLVISTQIFLALQAAKILVEEPYDHLVMDGLPDHKGNNKFWVLTADGSISAVEEQKECPESKFRAMELRSRVLSGTPENLQASLMEVRKVLDVLHHMPFELLTNKTTGLHVHIGNQRKGFPLQTLKNFAQVAYGFINAIQSIHPDHRIDGYESRYCRPMTDHLYIYRGLAENLESIEEAPSQDELANCVSFVDVKSDAYYFGNLFDRHTERQLEGKSRAKRTIEFRQHTGSVDADAVCAWVEVATGLIETCYYAPKGSMARLVLEHAEGSAQPALPDLLKLIRKDHLMAFYDGKLHLDREKIRFGEFAAFRKGKFRYGSLRNSRGEYGNSRKECVEQSARSSSDEDKS